MKYIKAIIVSLIIVGLCSIAALSIYYYHSHKIANLLQQSTKNHTGRITFTSSTENQAQDKEEREKIVHQMVFKRLQLGSADAAATIGPTQELEEELLKMLKSNQWVAATAVIQGLLYYYKWSPDSFSMKIRDVLVDILERELAKQKPPYTVGREGSEMDILTQDVCVLYNPRAIPFLLKLNMISCLSHYGEEGAGIVLSTSALLATEVAGTKLEAYELSDKKSEIIDAIRGFTNSPTSWNSLSPTMQNKLKNVIYDDLKDKSWGVRMWAIKALIPIADKNDITILKKLSKDPEKVGTVYPVREEAEKALTERAFLWNLLNKHTQESIRNNIYQKLKDKDWGIRLKGVKELSHIADKNDIPILEKLSKDPVSYVSEVANKTLESLKEKGNE